MYVALHRWSGEYVGFTDGRWLFDAVGGYLGWREPDGSVWLRDGGYLGQLIDNQYVLREPGAGTRGRKTPPVPPLPPSMIFSAAALPARLPRVGWTDALNDLGGAPSFERIAGLWQGENFQMLLEENGRYRITVTDGSVEAGKWRLAGGRLLLWPESDTENAVIYQIREFSAHALRLLRSIEDQISLPFTVQRVS